MNGYWFQPGREMFPMTYGDVPSACPETDPIAVYHSSKSQKPILCASSLQADCCAFLEFAPNVSSYTVVWTAIARTRAPLSFFLVHPTSGRSLILHCTSHHLAFRSENQGQLQALAEVAARHGCDFYVVTERLLTTGFRLENLRLFSRFTTYPVSQKLTAELVTIVCQSNSLPFSMLAALACPRQPQLASIAILKLLGSHLLQADIDTALLAEHTLVDAGDHSPALGERHPFEVIFGCLPFGEH